MSELIECRQHQNAGYALGLALARIFDVPPFKDFRAEILIGNVIGQVRRGHYIFTMQGERILGFAGWGWCDESVAAAWQCGESQPTYEECLQGDTMLVSIFYAKTREACIIQARNLREQCRGHMMYGQRLYKNGRIKNFKHYVPLHEKMKS